MLASEISLFRDVDSPQACLFLAALVGGAADRRLFAKDGDAATTPLKSESRIRRGQLVEAEQEYREVLRVAPSDSVAQRQLGLLYFEQGQIRQALPLLKRAADAEPDNLELKSKLVRSYLAASEFQLARDLAQQIIEKQPGQDEAMMLLADAGVRLNQIDDTRKLLDGIREEDKQRAGYHVAQGLLLLAQKARIGRGK